MNRDDRAVLCVAALLLSAIAAMVWPVACHGQAPPGRVRVDTVHVLPSGYLGITQCAPDGRVVSWLRADLDGTRRAEVEAHEAVHRAQAARYPTCEAYQAAYRSSLARQVEFEAEAYCAGMTAWVANGMSPDLARGHVMTHLAMLYMGASVTDVARYVTRWCP
jgi:hypothetical protein